MLNTKEIGDIGESLAEKHLISKGYRIVTRNWRFSRAEVDIIAKKDEVLIFIEVKTRSYTHFGKPEEFITAKKEALLIDAAQRYMEETGYDWEIRFDIISVIVDKKGKLNKIEHFEDAFF